MHYRIAKILALIIGIEACVVMIGWIFSVEALTRILPDGINMKFPTALLFFFSALGLYYIIRAIQDNYEMSQVVLPGIALFTFLLTGVLLTTGLFNIQTGIENLFVIKQSSINSWGLGLPSLPTVINFIIFGMACMFSLIPDSNLSKRFKFFGYPIFIIGLVAVFGYLLHIPMLYYQYKIFFVPMAFNTALTFVLLGCGLIIISFSKTTNET